MLLLLVATAIVLKIIAAWLHYTVIPKFHPNSLLPFFCYYCIFVPNNFLHKNRRHEIFLSYPHF